MRFHHANSQEAELHNGQQLTQILWAGTQVELCCRVAALLLRLHHAQLTLHPETLHMHRWSCAAGWRRCWCACTTRS